MKQRTKLIILLLILVASNSFATADSSEFGIVQTGKIHAPSVDSTSKGNLNNDITFLNTKYDNESWYIKYLLPAFIALILAILSFFISQMYLRYLDKKRSREKYIGILRVLAEEIKRNLDLECQLHAYLFVGILPTFSLSFFITDKIFSELTAVCLNYDLLKEIFHNYFEYQHIQNRIDRMILIASERDEIKKYQVVDRWTAMTALSSVHERYNSESNSTIQLIQSDIKGSFILYNNIVGEINLRVERDKMIPLPDNYLESKFIEFQTDPTVVTAAKEFNSNYLDKRELFY
jgi:hypothetical protein